jgi:hypothetical protein
VQFYQLDGNTWRKLDALESNAATIAPLERSMASQKKKLNLRADWPFLTSWQVRKWIDSSTALLYAHEVKTVEIGDETEAVSVSFSLPSNSILPATGKSQGRSRCRRKESAD